MTFCVDKHIARFCVSCGRNIHYHVSASPRHFRRVQCPSCFFAAENVPCPFFWNLKSTLSVFSGNACTAYFTAKVKRLYLTFNFNLEQYLELFYPPFPIRGLHDSMTVRTKVSGLEDWLDIVNENIRVIYFYANV